MNSTPEGSLILCPVCHRPNPPERQFCQHCWGAIIRGGNGVLPAKAEALSRYRLSLMKRRRIIKRLIYSFIPLIILASITYSSLYYFTDIVKPPQGMNSNSLSGEWAMFRHDLSNSGATGLNVILPQGKLKWTFATGNLIRSSPAVAGDTVYIGSIDNKLYALDAATGDERWEYRAGSWVESSPSIANGVVYFGSNDGKLYALDAKRGDKLWDFKTSYPVMSSPAVANGIVYFGSDDYYLYALNAATGSKLWAFDTGGTVKSSPVVARGIVYVGSGGEYSYAINALSGRLRLNFKTFFSVYSAPVVSDGIVYFTTTNGYLFAVDSNARGWPLEHGIRPYWTQMWLMGVPLVPPPPLQSGFLWGLTLDKVGISSPALVGDTLYIGSDKKLLAIDLQSRKQRWQFETKGVITSSPAVVGNVVYIASEDGWLYALNAATGEKIWDFFIGGKLTSSPTVANGIIYIGAPDGKLYAIE